MARGLSSAAKSYIGPIRWAVNLTLLDSTSKNYAQEARTFLGTNYEPFLGSVAPVRLTRTLERDSTEIELLNVDLTIGDLLRTKAFDGAECDLKMLLIGIEEEILVLRGRLSEEEQDLRVARFQLSSALDPANLRVPARVLTSEDFPTITPQQTRSTERTPGVPPRRPPIDPSNLPPWKIPPDVPF